MPFRRAVLRRDPNRALSHHVCGESDVINEVVYHKHHGQFGRMYKALSHGNTAAISEARILLCQPHEVIPRAYSSLPNRLKHAHSYLITRLGSRDQSSHAYTMCRTQTDMDFHTLLRFRIDLLEK